VDSYDAVHFDLADGTALTIERDHIRRVYDELWRLSKTPGAVSTAALLLDGAGRHSRYGYRIDLNGVQSAALRSAMGHSRD
jgi:hypothetical protein